MLTIKYLSLNDLQYNVKKLESNRIDSNFWGFVFLTISISFAIKLSFLKISKLF